MFRPNDLNQKPESHKLKAYIVGPDPKINDDLLKLLKFNSIKPLEYVEDKSFINVPININGIPQGVHITLSVLDKQQINLWDTFPVPDVIIIPFNITARDQTEQVNNEIKQDIDNYFPGIPMIPVGINNYDFKTISEELKTLIDINRRYTYKYIADDNNNFVAYTDIRYEPEVQTVNLNILRTTIATYGYKTKNHMLRLQHPPMDRRTVENKTQRRWYFF